MLAMSKLWMASVPGVWSMAFIQVWLAVFISPPSATWAPGSAAWIA
jgi:hypothetical protein